MRTINRFLLVDYNTMSGIDVKQAFIKHAADVFQAKQNVRYDILLLRKQALDDVIAGNSRFNQRLNDHITNTDAETQDLLLLKQAHDDMIAANIQFNQECDDFISETEEDTQAFLDYSKLLLSTTYSNKQALLGLLGHAKEVWQASQTERYDDLLLRKQDYDEVINAFSP